jgi:hypothetical protein
MITTGNKELHEHLADFGEDLLAKLDELIEAKAEVNVNVPAQKPPVVNVDVPAQKPPPRPSAWKFKVYRGADGLIDTITATPKI